MPADPAYAVSVVLPVYAGADAGQLDDALASLYAQTLPPDEVVVVEDGPLTPAHDAVLDRWATSEPPLRRVRLATNQGVARATQAGVEAAEHPWIARMDADDLAVPHRLATQVEAARSGDLDLVGSAMLEFEHDPAEPVGVRRMPEGHDAITRALRRNNAFNHPTVLVRRSLVLEVGGYRPMPGVEDYDLWARLWAAGARLHNLPEPLVLFRADSRMLRRRRQRGIHRAELRLQRNLHRYGLVSGPRMVANLALRTTFRMLPAPLMRAAYRRLFHAR